MSNPLKVERHDSVLHLRLNRPERLNAIDRALLQALRNSLAQGLADEAVDAIVFSGSGRSFCSGADIKSGEPQAASREWILGVQSFFEELEDADKPLIAAVHGHAFGLGMALASASDIVVADSSAVMALPEIRHGLVPGIALAAVVRRVPSGVVMDMSLSGRTIEERELWCRGLIDRQVPDGQTTDHSLSLASSLGALDREALRETKGLVRNLLQLSYRTGIDVGRRRIEGFRAIRQARTRGDGGAE